jgi:hypothetical protein
VYVHQPATPKAASSATRSRTRRPLVFGGSGSKKESKPEKEFSRNDSMLGWIGLGWIGLG